MNAISNNRRRFFASFVVAILALTVARGAEMRTWTNVKGQVIKAELLVVEGEDVRLRMEGGRDVTIKRKTLSAADQKYLTEYGGAKEMPIDPKAKVGVPEKTMRFDSKTIVRREDQLEFPHGFSLQFDLIESDHFLIATSGRARGKDIAELAERMWYGMNFQHPGFGDKWGESKKIIILCGEEIDYETLGEYEVNRIRNSAGPDAGQKANDRALTWPAAGANSCVLSPEMCEKYGAQATTRIFKAFDKRRFQSGVWNAFPVNVIASDMLSKMAGGAGGGIGKQGYFSLSWGHAYFKEIQLTGETVTTMLDADTYESDELIKAGGFEDGKKWARTLRDLVKKGKVTPDVEQLWRVSKPADVTPEVTVLMYGFSRYLQSTPARLKKYSEFLDRVDTSRKIPVPLEAAKIFGFETVKELQDDWTDYMKSTAFK